jgi:CARDB protein/SdrD B-like protein/FG-GAP repeat protein
MLKGLLKKSRRSVRKQSLALERLEERLLLAFTIPAEFDGDIDLNTGTGTGPDGVIRIFGDDVDDFSGHSVSSAGDVNGDGYDDMLIGAVEADPAGGSSAGETYLVFGKPTGLWEDIDFNGSVPSAMAIRIFGDDMNDQSGASVSSAGDVNSDGYDDLLIGAHWADPAGGSQAGEAYLVFGHGGAWADIDFNGSVPLATAIRIFGDDADDRSGYSVSSAGDVNDDGYGDLLIGAHVADPAGGPLAGETYLVFGHGGAWVDIDFNGSVPSTTAIRIFGDDAHDHSGNSVSSAGDVNSDGYDDLLIGAFLADPAGGPDAGETYLVFGHDGAWADIDFNGSVPPATAIRIFGEDAFDKSGHSVSSAGDVNDDGYGDLLIGAYSADTASGSDAGETYLVFGHGGAWADIDFNGTVPLATAIRIFGDDADDWSGIAVSSAGDVNSDGYDDLLIGAHVADPAGGSQAGETYLVFGHGGAWVDIDFNGTVPLATAIRIFGDDAFDWSGRAVSSAGDLNSDGYDDMLVGAAFADPAGGSWAGETYLVFGRGSESTDLYGTSFDVVEDPSPLGDTPLTVNYEITNGGADASGGFDVYFYISKDTTFGNGDDYTIKTLSLGSVAGSSTTGSLQTTVTPPAASDTWWAGEADYYIGMLVDYNDDVSETDEGNNSNRGTGLDWDGVHLEVGSADLIVEDITVAPTPPIAGLPATITATLRNQGDATATGSIRLEYYVGGHYIGHGYLSSSLGEGAAKTESISHTALTPEHHSVRVVVDTEDIVSESDEENNERIEPYYWDPQDGPDLYGTYFDVVEDPAELGATPLTVNYRIANGGTDASGDFDVYFYISKDTTFGNGDDYTVKTLSSGSIAADSITSTQQTTVVPPVASDTWWTGEDDYYIGMLVDYNDDVTETIEGNNSNRGTGLDWDGVHLTEGCHDDFEDDTVGTWPGGWTADANAISNPSNNSVVADPASGTGNVLKLFGAIGASWSALAYKPCDFGTAFRLDLRVYNGSEALSGTHPDRAWIGMRQGTSWANPARTLLGFDGDGTLVASDGSVIGSYSTGQWYDVSIDYLRTGSDLNLYYWINDQHLATVQMTVSDLGAETLLDHLDLTAQEGSAYFDDIQVTDVPDEADLALTVLSVSPSTVTGKAFTSCSFNLVNNGPMDMVSEGVMVDYYLSDDITFGDADDFKIGDTGFTLSIAAGATDGIVLSATGLGNMVRHWPDGKPDGNYYVFADARLTSAPPTDPNASNNYDHTDSTVRVEINILPGAISGKMVEDMNGNGVIDPDEPGRSGFEIELHQVVDAVDTKLADAVTGAGGAYSFDSVAPGTGYTVRVQMAGWQATFPTDDEDFNQHEGIAVLSGETVADMDFAGYQWGSIAGSVWNDYNRDGQLAGDYEPALSEWTVFLDANGDGEKDTGEISVTTTPDGRYEFTDLPPGDYTVVEVLDDPGAWQVSTADGVSHTVTVTSGNEANWDFGNYEELPYYLIAQFVDPNDPTVTVTVLDMDDPAASAADVDPADMRVLFGAGGSVSYIIFGSYQGSAMSNLGLMVSGASSVGLVLDQRYATGGEVEDVAFFASDAPVGLMLLNSGVAGYDVNGQTIAEFEFPADVDEDGTTDDLTGLYVADKLGTTIISGEIAGDVVTDGLGLLLTRGGGLSGDLHFKGDGGPIILDGDLTGSIRTTGGLSFVSVKNVTDAMIDVYGKLGFLNVTGAWTDSFLFAGSLGTMIVVGDFQSGLALVAYDAGFVSFSDVEDSRLDVLGGTLNFVSVSGDWTNSSMWAPKLGFVSITRELSATTPDEHEIHAMTGSFFLLENGNFHLMNYPGYPGSETDTTIHNVRVWVG